MKTPSDEEFAIVWSLGVVLVTFLVSLWRTDQDCRRAGPELVTSSYRCWTVSRMLFFHLFSGVPGKDEVLERSR